MLSSRNLEISEKVPKSLIAPIKSRLHGYKILQKSRRSETSSFEICVIKRAQGSLPELSFESKSSLCKNLIELLKYIEIETQEIFEIIQKTESPSVGL